MWLSKPRGGQSAQPGEAGVVSLGGEAPAAVSDCEQRALQVLAPGGYCWQPAAGDAVLVLKGGWAAGVAQPCPVTLSPGEVYIHCGGGSIYLNEQGEIHLTGKVFCNGTELGVV